MNEQQAENLRKLITHMETKVSRKLYMPYIQHPCGTPACAMGEVSMIPAFGLSRGKGMVGCLLHNGDPVSMRDTSERLFGLASDQYEHLFGGSLNGTIEPTPQEWAAEARKVLAKNGYTMVPHTAIPVPTAFDAFMEKVMESRPELQGLCLEPGCHR